MRSHLEMSELLGWPQRQRGGPVVYVHSERPHGSDDRTKREVLEGILPERAMRVREVGGLGSRAQG